MPSYMDEAWLENQVKLVDNDSKELVWIDTDTYVSELALRSLTYAYPDVDNMYN